MQFPVSEFERHLGDWLNEQVQVEAVESVGGGCINEARKVTLRDKREFFVKANSSRYQSMFEAESVGLKTLAGTDATVIPDVIGIFQVDPSVFLVLEWIDVVPARQADSEAFGRMLARLHSAKPWQSESGDATRIENVTSQKIAPGNDTSKDDHPNSNRRFGFYIDNFIGSTPQPNPCLSNWSEFFCEQRLGFQIRLAREQGRGECVPDVNRLLTQVRKRLPSHPLPSLIHGDLWSGNLVHDRSRGPVLIDPAPYFADREAEFGILTLFGGFDRDFFAGYEEAFPFESGFKERLPIYQLYHYLNHLNLFGTGYARAVTETVRKLL